MNREHEFQRLAQAEKDVAEGAEYLKWQREIVDILERISTCTEATERARALLADLLKTQAQREQDRNQIRLSLDYNSGSTVPLAPPVDHRTDLDVPVPHEQDCVPLHVSLHRNGASPSTVPVAQPQPTDHRTDLGDPVQHEQDDEPLHGSLHGDVASPSTVPVAQPQPTEDRTDLAVPVQREHRSDPLHATLVNNVASPSTILVAQPRPIDHQTELAAPAQRKQDGEPLQVSLHDDVVSPSTVPFGCSVDQQNKAIGIGDIAEPGAKRTLAQVGVRTGHFWWFVKTAGAWLSNLGRARSKLRN